MDIIAVLRVVALPVTLVGIFFHFWDSYIVAVLQTFLELAYLSNQWLIVLGRYVPTPLRSC